MSKIPFFSVIIVNYNGGLYLESAIKSVLNQNNSLFELIIIDGKSTDNSLDIINNHSSNIDYFISEKDEGQSDAFNKGFNLARGEYFLWLNSDDLLMPNCLNHAFDFINKNPGNFWFVANTIFTDEEGFILKCSKAPDWYDWAVENGVIYVNGPTSIFHRELFYKVGGFDLNCHYSMDTDLWMRFKKLGYNFKRINQYYWCFRIHKGSKTSGTLLGQINNKLNAEAEYISQKNNYYYSKLSRAKQIFLKIFTGSFLSSQYDTFRFKRVHIEQYLMFQSK